MSNSADFTLVQGDRETIQQTLERDATALDLTGRTVDFVMRHSHGTKVVDRAATIDDAASGAVSIELQPDETARDGNHTAEWVVDGTSEDPTTVPRNSPLIIDVRKDVEQEDTVPSSLEEDATVDTLFANALNGPLTGDVSISTLIGENLEAVGGQLNAIDAKGWATSEEIVPLQTFSITRTYSTTSTSYINVTPSTERPFIDFSKLNYANLSGYRASLAGTLTVTTSGDTAYARLGQDTETEISGSGYAHGGFVPISGSGLRAFLIEMKTDGDTVRLYNPKVHIWGVVE